MVTKRPTQADVARLANVSQTAVSKILNGNDEGIPEETRQRILGAMNQLGYVPNRFAQSLRTQKTYTIASIIPDITNPFYPAFQRGIQSITYQNEYDLIIYDTDEREENELRSLRSLERAGIDGAIVYLFHHGTEQLKPLIEKNIHVVYCGGKPIPEKELTLDTVYVDNETMAKTLVSFLIDKGHTHIGMIAGLKETPPRKNRIRGYQAAMSEHRLPVVDTLIQGGDFPPHQRVETVRSPRRFASA